MRALGATGTHRPWKFGDDISEVAQKLGEVDALRMYVEKRGRMEGWRWVKGLMEVEVQRCQSERWMVQLASPDD